MAYWGPQAFQNDQAADWVGELTRQNASKRIRRALVDVINFSAEDIQRWSKDKIDRFVERIVCDLRDKPPLEWKESGKTLEAFLADVERDLRDEYESERYLSKRYGPIEEGLAAAELPAIWGNRPPPRTPPYDDRAYELTAVLRRKLVPEDLLRLARNVVRRTLSSEPYRSMREFYRGLPEGSRDGDDVMAAVKNLAARLEQIKSSPTVSKPRAK